MFNLPWYSWFNVLALPLLWGLLYIDMAVLGRPAWMRKFLGFHITASVACIFLYWNPQLAQTLVPMNYLLALLILPYAAWNIAQGSAAFLQGVFKYFLHRFDRDRTPVVAAISALDQPADADGIDIHQDDLDLDEGVSCCTMAKDAEEFGQAVSTLFRSRSTAKERMDGVMKLLGDENIDDPSTELWSGIAALGVYLVVSFPPMYMSVLLLG